MSFEPRGDEVNSLGGDEKHESQKEVVFPEANLSLNNSSNNSSKGVDDKEFQWCVICENVNSV